MKTLPLALVVLAVIFAILAVLYFFGAVQFLTTTGTGGHPKHALILVVLAVVSLIAANFARRQTA